ncbi:MAG TPA: hypothetical protein VFP63_04105 [Dehalococcoidia bacterium]|nr:hypothetical protein [Dehalococcoidia bacterium]
MKWSPPLNRLWGGLWNMALFAIGHRGPTGDDWTWETPKGAGRAPLGGPLLPLAVALILGMLFGVTAIASLDRNDGPSPLAVLQPSPTNAATTVPTARPTAAVVRVPRVTASPAPTPSQTPSAEPPIRTPAATVRPATPPPLARIVTPVSTQIPSRPAANGPVQPPTPVPTPTPAPVTSVAGTVTGGGQAGGGQFSIHVVATGDGAFNSHFNYHSKDLRIESTDISGVALTDGPCGPGTRAILTGAGTVNGAGGSAFQVASEDCGEPGGWPSGGADYLRVTSGSASVEGWVSGNVQIHAE